MAYKTKPAGLVACKGCGNSIFYVKDEKGATHPLDPRAPVFAVLVRESDGEVLQAELYSQTVHTDAGMQGRAYVSHFATCREAAQFSKSSRSPSGPARH